MFAVCIGTDHLSHLFAAQMGLLVTLQARGVQGQLYRVTSGRPTRCRCLKAVKSGRAEAAALAWSALPSVISAQTLRACGASAFWRHGVWSSEESRASVLLLPVTG